MTKNQIRETVEKQLQLLSDRSVGNIDRNSLVKISETMLDYADWLFKNPTLNDKD